MRIIARNHGVTINKLLVALGAEDVGKSDMELVTEADNYSNYEDTRIRHFGGEVKHLPCGKVEIIVYID